MYIYSSLLKVHKGIQYILYNFYKIINDQYNSAKILNGFSLMTDRKAFVLVQMPYIFKSGTSFVY